MKIKNVGDVAYSKFGDKIVIANNDGNIYLLDAYSFK
jgi:hypothetical protein